MLATAYGRPAASATGSSLASRSWTPKATGVLLPTLATTIQILQVLRASGPARRISETSKTCATVEIGRLHFEADRSLRRQLVICVVRSLRARGDGSPTAWQHYMLIVVGVVQGRPRRRLDDDACVGLGYAVAALVNYDVGAARRAAWSCRGGSSKQSSSMALGGLLHVRLVCKTLSLSRGPQNPFCQGKRKSILR